MRTEIVQMATPGQAQPAPAAPHAGNSQPAPDAGQAWDLKLLSALKDASGLPTSGTNLVVVALVNDLLHFRMFGADGKQFVDTDESGLLAQAEPLEALRRQLVGLWPPHELTAGEKCKSLPRSERSWGT